MSECKDPYHDSASISSKVYDTCPSCKPTPPAPQADAVKVSAQNLLAEYDRVVRERGHWKANHDAVVEKKQRLSDKYGELVARSAKLLEALKEIADRNAHGVMVTIARDAIREWEDGK